MVTRALKRLWTDRCTVMVRESERGAAAEEFFRDVTLIEDEPCRLSHKRSDTVSSGLPQVNQSAVIFMSPETVVPEGSWIYVTRNGRTEVYKRSGTPAVYSGHQEIPVVKTGIAGIVND